MYNNNFDEMFSEKSDVHMSHLRDIVKRLSPLEWFAFECIGASGVSEEKDAKEVFIRALIAKDGPCKSEDTAWRAVKTLIKIGFYDVEKMYTGYRNFNILKLAYKERAIPLLNWDLIEYPKELGFKKVVSLSKDQEQALIQCIYMDLNRKTAGILIALFTGVRIGELCGLQMKDISLTDKTISINKTVQRIYDKKKGTSYLHIGPPKTKTSARTIPVPSLLMNIIKKFYTENPNHYFLTGKTKPTEPRTYRQFFSRFLKRNGLQKVKFHEIRHTFAVRAIEIPEFDIKSLSEILGHKNVSFTLNVYGSANLQQKVKCMNLLNDLL